MEATTQTPLSLVSFQLPPHLFIPLTLIPLSLCTSPLRALSFSCSVLPDYWRVKGMLQSYWLHNRLLIPLSAKNKHTCITTGGLRKSKKAVTMKIEYRGVKKILFETVVYSRFHKNACSNSQLLIRGNHMNGSSERNLLLRKLFFLFFFHFFFLPLVCVLGSR